MTGINVATSRRRSGQTGKVCANCCSALNRLLLLRRTLACCLLTLEIIHELVHSLQTDRGGGGADGL